MDVHLREQRYFVAVAEHLHFGRAADALFVSQPALSKQIRALESQLRATLFDRDRRSVRLTADGCALLPHARTVLEAWVAAEAELARAAAVRQATLVVGMSTGPGRGLLPSVRARLDAAAPGTRLQLRQVSWGDPTGGLADGGPDRTDAAFVWLPLPQIERFDHLLVAREPRVLALPPGHRLAGASHVHLDDVLDEPFLALPTSSGAARDHWLAVDARHGRPVRVGAEIANVEEAVEALAAGLGVCLLAAGNAPLVSRDGVTTVPLAGVGPADLALVWRRGDRRPLLQLLVAAAREAATPGG